jgi:hypothetical protein
VEGEAGEEGEERGRESVWSVLEKLDDDLEQWGESEGYRKEDRFFGTLQGSGYQVSVTHTYHPFHLPLIASAPLPSQERNRVTDRMQISLYRYPSQPCRDASAAASKHNSLQTRRARLTGNGPHARVTHQL